MIDTDTTHPIDRDLAIKVLDIVDQGLVNGMGQGKPGSVCVEAAVCLAMGLPHSDDPPCVHPMVRQLKIELNDRTGWSSKEARAKGLRRVAIAQLGSNNPDFDGGKFLTTVRDRVRDFVKKPRFDAQMAEHRQTIQTIAEALSKLSVHTHPRVLSDQLFAVREKLGPVIRLQDQMDIDPRFIYEWDKVDEQYLCEVAEVMVQVLIEMGSPGAAFLDLAPLPAAA